MSDSITKVVGIGFRVIILAPTYYLLIIGG
jgi:hypothetical protein